MFQTQQLINRHIPVPHRISAKGWHIFSSVCCHHRGHKTDTRNRGNILFDQNFTTYNCYNCGFKVVFDEINLSHKAEQLLRWLGVEDNEISELKLLLLKNKLDGNLIINQNTWTMNTNEFESCELPKDADRLENWAAQEPHDQNFLATIEYLYERGQSLAQAYDYYWSPMIKYAMNKRLIIPFYYRGNIVGWTARYIDSNPNKDIPRYFNSSIPQGYLFNFDSLFKKSRKYCLIHEGPFDAIATDGVAVMGGQLSKEQLYHINSSDKIKIVVPDRQRKNQGLIDQAIENNWFVSFPDWEDAVKDAADAAKKYGRIYTLRSIIDSKTDSKLMIGIKRQMYRN